MATGYTYPVRDGKVTSFAEFALECARGMGAAIHQRDDGPGPITEMPVDDFEQRHAEKARANLAAALDRTPTEWAELQAQRHAAAEKALADAAIEQAQIRERYEAMLLQVLAWKPPTDEHIGLKNFMVEQLEQSIRFDCPDARSEVVPPMLDPAVYAAREIDHARDQHDRAEQDARQARERVAAQRAWVRNLRESLLGTHDHTDTCCRWCGTHVTPHRGCILR